MTAARVMLLFLSSLQRERRGVRSNPEHGISQSLAGERTVVAAVITVMNIHTPHGVYTQQHYASPSNLPVPTTTGTRRR
ncbi:hypothetical protein HOY80DRAFT_956401 [Tuber brumale]|nr:hypothetical protein HOY80DRAFT_956401 [Tuber brumale]